MNPILAQGTRIFLESSRGAAQAISGITKAAPPVITYAGADPANNSYLILKDMTGMTEFQDAVIKVANVNGAGNTLEAKDQDSTNFGTFTAGNIYPVEFATEIQIATDFRPTGGESQFANYRLLHERIERRKFSHTSAAGIDVPVIWDPTDPTFKLLYEAGRTGQEMAIKLLFPNGVEMLTFGSIGGSGLPNGGDATKVMEASFSINSASKAWYVLP